MEGVPSMPDMIGVLISFARRRRVDLFQCALTLRQIARSRSDTARH